jgi:hypothetical protein
MIHLGRFQLAESRPWIMDTASFLLLAIRAPRDSLTSVIRQTEPSQEAA